MYCRRPYLIILIVFRDVISLYYAVLLAMDFDCLACLWFCGQWADVIVRSNGMFMYKINQYLLFGLINIVRIFNIQHINRTDGTLLKRAKEVPVTELFIVCKSSRGMLRIPSTSCPTTVIPPSIVAMICFCSILSIFCSSSNIM